MDKRRHGLAAGFPSGRVAPVDKGRAFLTSALPGAVLPKFSRSCRA